MKKIINFTPTGTQPTRENSSAPLEVNEIIEEVHQAYEIGISITHIHARDPETFSNTYKKEIYGQIIQGIRKYCPELLVCASLTGRNFPELSQRTEVLECLPDMGSLTMSSLNFPSGTSTNQPKMILDLISKMGEYGVQPEIECFDSGMVNYTKYLISKNILKPPFYMNVILGNIYNAQSDLSSLAAIKSAIPHNVTTCIGGIGNQQLKSNIIGLMEFDGIRIGLEDNLYYKGKIKATNIELLKRAYRIMDELEMECMSSKELRKNGYGNKLIDSREG
jgi:3-keto-5-aminohexanoate cleavage enzyme